MFDKETRNKLQLNNSYAIMKISELLMRSGRRGYWKVDQEKLRKLGEIIVDMESEVE